MKRQWKWFALLGAALFAFSMADEAKADHFRRGCGGYGYGAGYGYGGGYGASAYSYPSYGYGGYGGYYNRTNLYHYSSPRVTTGYGFRSYGSPYGYGRGFGYGRGYGYGRGFGYGGRGGGLSIYGSFGRW